jgi:DNA-binding transcriptional regulator YiaG
MAWKGKAGMDGSELKALRYKLNLSLSQASRQVEVSVSTWCRWESGKQKIPEGAVKLFKLLNKIK